MSSQGWIPFGQQNDHHKQDENFIFFVKIQQPCTGVVVVTAGAVVAIVAIVVVAVVVVSGVVAVVAVVVAVVVGKKFVIGIVVPIGIHIFVPRFNWITCIHASERKASNRRSNSLYSLLLSLSLSLSMMMTR